MKMKDKILISIIFVGLILIVLALCITIPSFKGEKEISLGSFTISAQSYNAIQDNYGDEKIVSVCNMDEGKCVWLANMDNF